MSGKPDEGVTFELDAHALATVQQANFLVRSATLAEITNVRLAILIVKDRKGHANSFMSHDSKPKDTNELEQ